MSKQRALDVIQTAQRRAVAIDSTAPGFALGEALTMPGYLAGIDAARDTVFQYIALESRLKAQRGAMLAARRTLAEWSNRMLCATHSTYGKDSPQYQAIAAASSSAPRRRPRKRRGADVATGRRADGPMPGPSTDPGPVEDADPVAQARLVGTGVVAVGEKGGVGTGPQGDVADERDAPRRMKALAPRERHEDDAGPADAMERVEEIDGADPGRALADGPVVAGPFHGDALKGGKDQGAGMNRGRPHVVEDAEDEGQLEDEEAGDAPGGANVPVFHGRSGAPWRDQQAVDHRAPPPGLGMPDEQPVLSLMRRSA